MEFILLNLLFLTFFAIVIFAKEYRGSVFVYYLGIAILFLTPAWYIYIKGEKYLSYSQESAEVYFLLGCVAFVHCIFVCLIRLAFNKRLSVNYYNEFYAPKKILLMFFIFTILVIIAYVIYYWREWPLLNAFSGNVIDRPDTVKGNFKGYFTYSVVVQVLLPAIYFYFFFLYKENRVLNTLFILLVSFFIIIGGNKGIFLYFILFYFLYVLKKISIVNYTFYFITCVFVYAVMKGAFSNDLGDSVNAEYLVESITTRFFVAQGISIPNVIEMTQGNNAIAELDSEELKSVLFEYVYGYSPGSMPLIYIAEIFIKYNVFIFLATISVFTFLISFVSLFVEKTSNLSILWVFYYCLYALVMAGISDANLLRFVFSIIVMIIIYAFSIRKRLNSE
ncbi:O-antigen polymerase [Brenneria corticis]|uniref:Oligosaccharide repeat unit polymerase n=1 Tax=Brenneria corticis TaxID=2173106 RepID=A0A2U1TJX6_9GAMM|nr:O-antigen polymerase [Brenneria sp. CFCC 11842]PWC09724.1 hypothetical protein DDT56_23290 [Brenneria sp. CFCC 11842]